MARQDIRLDMGFINHPKTKRVIRKLGHKGFYSLVCLFSNVAKIYPKGRLKDCDEIDIADLAFWDGDPAAFVKVLTEEKVGFLELVEGEYQIHDWEENQPYIFYADKRSEAAKKAANTRWNTDEDAGSNAGSNAEGNAGSMQTAYEPHQFRIADGMPSACGSHPIRNAPSPTPTPTPTPIPNPNSNTAAESKARSDDVSAGAADEASPPAVGESSDSESPPGPETEPSLFAELPATKSREELSDMELFKQVDTAFLKKNNHRYPDYGRERRSIKNLIKKAKKYTESSSEGSYQAFLQQMVVKFWQLKTQSREPYWRNQPFLPSALNAGGIWPRVLEQFREYDAEEDYGLSEEQKKILGVM